MIARVRFVDEIPIDLQRWSQTFDAELGWEILEEAPGRVRLRKVETGTINELIELTVQGHAYTLQHEPDPEPSEPPPSKPAEGKHRGRRRP